jgi:hypothetical protein
MCHHGTLAALSHHMKSRLILLSLVAAGCQGSAHAQTYDDPLGPIRCFNLADAAELASQSAIELCSGALSDAPGRCYVQADDTLQELSSQKVLQLCGRATSLDPLACYERLDATGTLTEDQILAYCTTSCAVGPPPAQVSDPACMEVALDRADLALESAGELCAFSRSDGPAQCFIAGQDTELADSSLIQLCAESTRCQYYNVAAEQ